MVRSLFRGLFFKRYVTGWVCTSTITHLKKHRDDGCEPFSTFFPWTNVWLNFWDTNDDNQNLNSLSPLEDYVNYRNKEFENILYLCRLRTSKWVSGWLTFVLLEYIMITVRWLFLPRVSHQTKEPSPNTRLLGLLPAPSLFPSINLQRDTRTCSNRVAVSTF